MPPLCALLVLSALGFAGCNGGTLFVTNVSQNGNIIDLGSSLCNPVNVNGTCQAGQSCLRGTCYDTHSLPAACAANINGPCTNVAQACVAGACVDIGTDTCDAQHFDGLCPGGQVCAHGYCYIDDGEVTCSSNNPTGSCPSGQSCTDGVCQTFFAQCNSTQWGQCATWQACSEGECVGPAAPDACSAAQPKGRCPVDNLCIGGSCTQVTSSNACSATHLNGLCEQGAACSSGGVCIGLTTSNSCSTTSPTGLCAAGGTCQAGVCEQSACSPQGGYLCPAGQSCLSGACTVTLCDVLHPDGACIDTTQACVLGRCAAPTCAAQEPNGSCPVGLICSQGACTLPPCAHDSPNGPCPDPINQICSLGTCTLRACSVQSPEGSCSGLVCTNDPQYGCIFHMPGQCCDTALASASTCTVGHCAPPLCSAQEPNGACPDSTICRSGTCVAAPCSTFYPAGLCADTNQQCVQGRCAKTQCSNQADPNAYCDPYMCDTTRNICVPAPCSPAHTQGTCPVGNACCNAGMQDVTSSNYDPGCVSLGSCIVPQCSPQYPGGSCGDPNLHVCAVGQCVVPPCSARYPQGSCGPNFTCNAGSCALLPCAQSQGHGSCTAGSLCAPANGNTFACVPYVCSNTYPNAPCSGASAGQTCVNLGSSNNPNYQCQHPACTPATPGGVCSDANFPICASGTCVVAGCSTQHPAGVCPRSHACISGRCQLDPCVSGDPAYPGQPAADPNDSGACPNGEACCNVALQNSGYPGCTHYQTCVTVTCSRQFPFGQCTDANQICVNSNSTTACEYVCSSAHKVGFCPGGFACVQGACAQACVNDQDCDTISDSDEGIATLVDTDSDGVPDAFDHDSDNDTIPDSVEAGDRDLGTPPLATHAMIPNFRSTDSDGDYIADILEAGPAPGIPRSSDGDAIPDYIDTDSDGDGILDQCEATDVGPSLCANTTLITIAIGLADSGTDSDGKPDYLDLDSDDDKIPDSIEGRATPAHPPTSPQGVNHDAGLTGGDNLPDYRDPDSDADGVADVDEDVNGDGIVNCQLDGSGNPLPDARPAPTCGGTTVGGAAYDYNPGCPAAKCLLAETNRVVGDTDGNGIADGQDGIFEVCSTANLKPINVFYSQQADYAFALERSFDTVRILKQSGTQVGMTIGDTNSTNGSRAVAGFLLHYTPSAAAQNATSSDATQILTTKALAQATSDQNTIATLVNPNITQVLNRNFKSFDGYGVALTRYRIIVPSTSAGMLRDKVVAALENPNVLDSFTPAAAGPTDTDFTLIVQTLFRGDPNGLPGTVVSVGAVVPTGANPDSPNSYTYRTHCAQQTAANCTTRPGCAPSAANPNVCLETVSYQIPLFFADNLTNGSAITQYGDDIAALCQSLLQGNGPLDFMWTVDNSGSMADKIGQVVTASSLFFPILANSEADYRVGMTTTSSTSPYWPPQYPGCYGITVRNTCENNNGATAPGGVGGCSWNAAATPQCAPMCTNYTSQSACVGRQGCLWGANPTAPNSCTWGGCGAVTDPNTCTKNLNCVYAGGKCGLVGIPDQVDGSTPEFTGAIAGITDPNSPDRSSHYACSEKCVIGSATCCPACTGNPNATPNDPACYFAARLPNDYGSGNEHGILMTEWALYRAGVQPSCRNAGSVAGCATIPGCVWDTASASCISGYCANSYVTPTAAFNPNVSVSPRNTPQAACLGWQNGSSTTPPTIGSAKTSYYGEYESPALCEYDAQSGTCFPSVGLACFASNSAALCNAQGTRCTWTGTSCLPVEAGNRTLCNGPSQAACAAQGIGFCTWDTCNYTSASACLGVAGCQWSAGACQATDTTNNGTCRPPLKHMMRDNAAKLAIIVSDEEDCYNKDGPSSNQSGNSSYDGSCAGGQYTGGLNLYGDPVRLSRVRAAKDYMRAHGVTTFSLVGDAADITKVPSITTVKGNGGCKATLNGVSYNAESGQAYIDVAQGNGGGWGSLCALNLYPSIETIVVTGIFQASPYRLEGLINGAAVQPIASTIEVAVQGCKVASEYPGCSSGTAVNVVPRSRDNGFDYDPSTNALVLYGNARAATQGSITVSYRYWVNSTQSPSGPTATSCPCPETNGNASCACAAGQACGISGTPNPNTLVNHCTSTDATVCNNTPGCTFNRSGAGFCEATGLCAPDPTCGGACGAGATCDPSQGLCTCDISCNGGCAAGRTCDNNENINQCSNVPQASCTGNCAWNAQLSACISATCGTCVCDTSCGGGCAAGGRCDSSTSSPTCGQCACDTSCGGGCPIHEVCNNTLSSPTCGLCQPPACGSCPVGFICSPSSNICVCDASCGGVSPPSGQLCDSNPQSATCGQLICDTSCGGSCPAHQLCDSDPNTSGCGFCFPDPTCGVGGMCNPVCSGSTETACTAVSGCRWKKDANGTPGCFPSACQECAADSGLCTVDTACTACGCNGYETCDGTTGACVCDTTCRGGSCGVGTLCDNTPGSSTCGHCVCDTSCGGACQAGQKCDTGAQSPTCGTCVIDSSCGTGCGYPLVCNPTTGLCGPDPNCGGCPSGFLCDTSTGQCVPQGG